MNYLQRIVSKLFRLGPAVIEPADVAFGTDPAEWAPTRYGEYLAISSSVYACASLRARSLAGLKIHAFQDGEELTEGPLVDLLQKVNPHWTFERLIHMTELSLCLWGQAFLVIERGDDGEGVPTEIWWARPDNMRVVPDTTNYLAGYIYEWNNQRIAFKASEVVWLRYPNPLDEFAGLSPLAAARLAVDTGHAALRSNHAIFKNGVQLAGIVTPDDKDSTWQSDQVKALRDMLEQRFKGADKAHRLAVLGQSAKFQAMGVSPRDAQFIELMEWTRSDVAMVLGVPPELIGDNSHSTYNNVREAHRGVWNDTLIPEAEMIAAELTEQLLPMFGEEGLSLAWDYSGVNALASDMVEIADQAKTWAEIGVPLNAILSELAPQFLTYSPDGKGYAWGDVPVSAGLPAPADEQRSVKFAEYPGLRFIAPQGVRDAARRGLELHEQGRSGDGLKPQTVREAREIAARRDVSPDKIRRMRAWFARHESDKKPGWGTPGKETPGYVAWLLWGGDPGRAWATKMIAAMDRIDSERGRSVGAVAQKAIMPITRGSAEHKAAYENFGRRADRIMATYRREVVDLFERQADELSEALAIQAAKALDNEADVDAIWDEVYWQTLFAEALINQIETATELGALDTLGTLDVSATAFNLRSPEVQASMLARSQAFAQQVNETTWFDLRRSLMAGINNGEGIDDLQGRVRAVMADRIQSSAETIARTETIGALTEGSLMGAKAAEETGITVRKQWLSTFDGRERESHAAAHDRYQREAIGLDESFLVGGVAFKSPGNPTGGRTRATAAESINCRCSMTYVTDEDDTEGRGVLVSNIAAWLEDC